jgi:hypothetical protein
MALNPPIMDSVKVDSAYDGAVDSADPGKVVDAGQTALSEVSRNRYMLRNRKCTLVDSDLALVCQHLSQGFHGISYSRWRLEQFAKEVVWSIVKAGRLRRILATRTVARITG